MSNVKTTPGHTSVTMTTQSVAYNLTIPAGTLSFWFQINDLPAYKLQYSYGSGIFMTVPAGSSVAKPDVLIESPLTLRVKCPDAAGQICVLEYWK